MISGDLLNIQPSELKFPFELKKQSSCSMQLTNKTDKYVAFKVKTTNPKKYCVRPNTGVVLPGSSCNVTVTMQAQKEAPPDLQCKDKFLLQSVAAPDGATTKDIGPELFNKEEGKVVEELKLRVIYIPANPPSPVPEGSEEGSSPRASPQANGNQNVSSFDDASIPDTFYKNLIYFFSVKVFRTVNGIFMSFLFLTFFCFYICIHTHIIYNFFACYTSQVSRSLEAPKEKSSEAWSMISKLTDEKTSAMQQNKKLLQELVGSHLFCGTCLCFMLLLFF
ncbi:hypothetical protein Dsin_026359 [Dipteronia sinensis]|uniref:MSP domain-containing protein n=1 Tax=Dipteronia sinensis TaxID=43782 RepID=A0AAE0DZ73_9ROSI|nr:hypothetical protein Dsin_026359 [Dipteronia sinensis]